MNFNPLALLLTVIGGLTVAGIIAWIRRPRLVVLVPRTFSYSQITDRGQLIEVTVFNRSFKTEEAIDVTLNPALTYEMLGANSQDVTVVKNRIHITRVGPSDEVTVLLMVENGAFKPDDITQTLSKETKGKTVSKLEKVPPTGPQRVALVALVFGLPLLLYAGTLGIEYLVKRTSLPRLISLLEAPQADIKGWKIASFYRRSSSYLYSAFASGQLSASVGSPLKKGDIASVPVRVQNNGEKIITFTASMTTAASEQRIPSYERRTDEVVVLPGKVEERSIKVVVPEKPTHPAEQLVFIEVFFQTMDGDSMVVRQDFAAK